MLSAIDVVMKHNINNIDSFKMVTDYNVDNVSIKVTRIILSYIDYVNRTVWKKDTVTKTF